MKWLRQALTGADNETVAIGRLSGLVLIALVLAATIIEPFTVAYRTLDIDQWGKMLAQWQVFVPVMFVTAAGVISGTAFTEPKPKDGGQ